LCRRRSTPEVFPFARTENLAVFGERRAKDMVIGGSIEWSRRLDRLMDIIETLAIRSEGETPQISAAKSIRKSAPIFDVENFKRSHAFSADLDFVKKQFGVRRHSNGFDGCVPAGPTPSRVEQELVLAA
jgi:hypothetical protein